MSVDKCIQRGKALGLDSKIIMYWLKSFTPRTTEQDAALNYLQEDFKTEFDKHNARMTSISKSTNEGTAQESIEQTFEKYKQKIVQNHYSQKANERLDEENKKMRKQEKEDTLLFNICKSRLLDEKQNIQGLQGRISNLISCIKDFEKDPKTLDLPTVAANECMLSFYEYEDMCNQIEVEEEMKELQTRFLNKEEEPEEVAK